MSAKDILVKPISSTDANALIKRVHYSGKVVQNSKLHLGVFYAGKLEGVMSFGSSLDKSKIIGLVRDTEWNGFMELNRMAFTDALPRNSESRAISVAMKMLKKYAPKVEWIISFADGTQCGDGTIYRASGFVLTAINKSKNLARLPDGSVIHKLSLESSPARPRPELNGKSYYDVTNGKYNFQKYVETVSGEILTGFQLRYIYFVNPATRDRLTVPILPFSDIGKMGATMYKGVGGESIDSDAANFQLEQGGATPTSLLHPQG